jgi:hypothetical protein
LSLVHFTAAKMAPKDSYFRTQEPNSLCSRIMELNILDTYEGLFKSKDVTAVLKKLTTFKYELEIRQLSVSKREVTFYLSLNALLYLRKIRCNEMSKMYL